MIIFLLCLRVLPNANLEVLDFWPHAKAFWFIEIVLIFHFFKWDALHGLIPFAQLKKREKHPWRSVACNFTKSNMAENCTKNHKYLQNS